MKIGIHNVFASADWNVDLLDMLPRAAKAGFDFVEINPQSCFQMTKAERDEILHCAKDIGLELQFSCGLPKKYDTASTDEAERVAAVAYVRELIGIVHEMGGTLLAGSLYAAWPFRPTGPFDKRKMWDCSVRSVKEVMDLCEGYGIDLACEVLNRFEHVLINTVAEGLRFIDEVGSNRACLTLDSFHMNIEESCMVDAIHSAKGRIADVHFGENNRRFPGQGKIAVYVNLKTSHQRARI